MLKNGERIERTYHKYDRMYQMDTMPVYIAPESTAKEKAENLLYGLACLLIIAVFMYIGWLYLTCRI